MNEQRSAGPLAEIDSDGSTDTSPRLSCAGVTVRFGGLVAVDSVDLTVPPGGVVGLVGPNGAGKTTIFGALSGLIRPSDGAVFLDGVDITGESAEARAARGLARTFQHPELFGGLSVRDHLVLARRVKRVKGRVLTDAFTMGGFRPAPSDERRSVDDLLEMLGIDALAGRPAVGLPLGVARLVELGRALATDPSALLLDEPSSGLDSEETRRFEDIVRQVVSERHLSVLLVEHDIEFVMRLCDQVTVLDFGRLIASGSPDEIQANPAVRAAYLGEENPLTEEPRDGTTADSSGSGQRGRPVALVSVSASPDSVNAGNADSSTAPESAPKQTGALVEVNGLSVRYGDAVALSEVSLRLDNGRALAVLGSNGAGKSSLARAVSGLVPVAGGNVVLAGASIVGWSAHRIRRAGVVHLPEGRGIFRSLTVIDNLRMATGTERDRATRHEAVATALEIFPALSARRRHIAGLLSGGEQQMLSLARALTASPRLIVADELSLGLAPKMVNLVFEGLDRARSAGIAVILIEQYVHRALAFADECLILQRGGVAWRGAAAAAGDEVLRHYLGDHTALEDAEPQRTS